MHELYFQVNKKVQSIREHAHTFAKEHVKPLADSIDQQDKFHKNLWPHMGKLGFLGINAETDYQGLGMGYLAHILVMEEISARSAALGLSYGAHSELCVNHLSRYGTESQKKRYLPQLIDGTHMGGLAMTEPNAGSDIMSMQLQATPCDKGFYLKGTKQWITNAPEADIILVYAKTNQSLTAFIVETNQPGLIQGKKENKLGMRGSATGSLTFNNFFVSQENVLGTLDQGHILLKAGLDYERLLLSAGPLGIMHHCLNTVIPFCQTREQFGQPIGNFQLIQAKLADMYTALNSSRAYVYTLANACDQGKQLSTEEAASVLLYTAECASKVATETIQCLGAKGYMNNSIASRLFRDAKLYEIGAGTSEIRRIIIGKSLIKNVC